jgi:glutaminyl-peptide cyclotransferase
LLIRTARAKFFRIAVTLSAPTKPPNRPQTQTRARRGLVAPLLLAFLLSACNSANPSVTNQSNPTPRADSTIPPIAATDVPASPTTVTVTQSAPAERFNGMRAYDDVLAQMRFGARPAGSLALRATGDYILNELDKSGWQTETQEFDYRGIPIRNIIAKTNIGQGPVVIVGAHYDTRPRANMDKQNPSAPVPGANDGASGVAVLLELARALDKTKLKNEIWLAFFDAEDNGDLSACDLRVAPQQKPTALCDTSVWTWSIGAEHVAETLNMKPAAVIILDMIGDADQNIYYEANSDQELNQQLWNIAAQLGYRQWFIPQVRWSMSDDHTPFLEKGIRAVDMIDFDYPPWHTTQDTADKVSADSLERVGRVMQTWLEGGVKE